MTPLISEIIMLRQMGISPQMAMQQLAKKYPYLQQALPYVQGKNPKDIDLTAKNMARSMGFDPMKVMSQFMGGKR